MDYSLASDKQLKTIVQFDIDCSPSLLRGVVIEMIKRRLWDGVILYAAKQVYFNPYQTMRDTLEVDFEEFVHISHIEMLKTIERFQPGRRNFKSYLIMYLCSYYKKLRRDAEALKRKANLRTKDVEGLDLKLKEKIFQSPVNVEKYVIDKITLEDCLKTLRKVEQQAVYLEALGYTQYEIAERLGYEKKYGYTLLKRAYEKLKKIGA